MTTSINFTKMQGLGNDFIILNYKEYEKVKIPTDNLATILCDRNFGIGADGLIIVNPYEESADIGWIFYNSDGSIAQMCGNGMRCFAKYVHDSGIIDKTQFSVSTKAGVIVPEIIDSETIRVNMSAPILDPRNIPVKVHDNLNFDIEAGDRFFIANAVSMGNPHCVIFTEEDTKKLALKYGNYIEKHELFPQKTNVEFVKVISSKELVVDVWERGCAITLACGTGACASVVAAILNNLCEHKVKVNLPGGSLIIEWDGSLKNTNKDVYMSGPAEYVFTGTISIPDC